jgi:hypothetical protein
MKSKKWLWAFVGVLVAAAVAASTARAIPAGADNTDGRQLAGQFCTNPNAMPAPGACIQLAYGDQTAQGYTDSPTRVLTLRPGIYWLTVTDTSPKHNFSLASPDGSDQDLTGVADTPGEVTVKVNLTHGTWVLFCDPHRAMGMYVDIEVGGVGQVG